MPGGIAGILWTWGRVAHAREGRAGREKEPGWSHYTSPSLALASEPHAVSKGKKPQSIWFGHCSLVSVPGISKTSIRAANAQKQKKGKKKKKDYGMTSNSRLIHQWVFPDIHVKTRFVKACGCTQVLLIICKGNWQQREHPKWLCSSETSEMHLPSLLIFSQCDHGACVCISQSLRFYLSTPLWCQGVLQFKKTQMHSLQVACSFTFLPNAARVYSVFSLSSR